MKINEVISVDEDMPDSTFINGQINPAEWTKKGSGATASVWQHVNDPDTVVKVTGGGYSSIGAFNTNVTMAFVHFCVDHGWESKHYPIIHGINTDDPDIVQVRIEALRPVDSRLGNALGQLADEIKFAGISNSGWDINRVNLLFKDYNIQHANSAHDIAVACELLLRVAPKYAQEHNVTRIRLDLHSGNWMQRADGTIVAIDPWHGD